MPPEYASRQEFEVYVHRHEADHYAHAPMRHDLRSEIVGEGMSMDLRLSALERWQQRMVGGLAFGAIMLGGGGIAAVVEFLRR